MDMACRAAESESHRPREFSPENRMTPPARSLVAQLSGVNSSVLSLAPSSSVISLASSNDVRGTNDMAEPPAPAADVPRISGPAESPAPADGGVRTTGPVGISAPMPPQHNPILALFALMNGAGALPASDPIIGPDRRPGLYHRPSKTQTLAASLLRYYVNPLRRQQVFTAVLGVSIDIYLLDAFLTTTRADAFTVDSLNGLLSLDVVTKLNACAWTSLPAVEKDAVDLLWRHCVKDELPVIYYAVTLGFGDVIVGQEEFAALFAGSLYLYQQHGPDWLPTREQLKQAGEALIDALVNETLEIQLLGYLSLPALFFAGQHMRPMSLNAQQAANVAYKLEAVVQFKQFWRKRMTVLKSANAQLRLYAQSVANELLARGQATFTAEASSEARISQEEGDTPACGALIADATPVAGRQTTGALAYDGVNAAMSGDAKAVAEHFCIIGECQGSCRLR